MNKQRDYIYKFGDRYFGALEKEHITKLKNWRNSQMKILRQFSPLSDFHQEKWWSHLKDDKSQVLFSIYIQKKENMEFIGYCGITNLDFKNRKGEISFL
ncbi:MAG: hypothetical protein ABH837_03715, partial [bacterium]